MEWVNQEILSSKWTTNHGRLAGHPEKDTWDNILMDNNDALNLPDTDSSVKEVVGAA
jgi:hypothetical protein